MKRGFTLAEALITLGIIGVIAAIGIPQVVTMAQKHQSEAMVSKIVYQTELGVQKILYDYNSENGSMSHVDKLLLVKDWDKKLAQAFHLTEKQPKIAFFDNLLMAPAYAEEEVLKKTYEKTDEGLVFHMITREIREKRMGGHRAQETITCEYKSIFQYISTLENIYTTHHICSFRYDDPYFDDSDHATDTVCHNGYPCNKCHEVKTYTNFATGEVEEETNDWDECPKDEPADDPEPVAEIPVPQEDEPAAGFDKVYHVFGLPAEVRMIVFNSSDSNSRNANQDVLTMLIDTNGFGQGKDKSGVDEFLFTLTNSGKMIPSDDKTKEFVKNGFKIK